MKRLAAAFLSLFITRAGYAQSSGSDVPVTGQGSSTTVTAETAVRKPVDLQSSQVQVVTTIRDDSGKSSYLTNSYFEVANGLNYLGTNGTLLPSVAAWELVPGAAIAWKTQTKVTLGATLDSAAPVQIRLPSGELMSSRVQGVAIFDAQSGKSVLVSEIKEGVQGIQMASDQIIYPDCLQGAISGDLRYTIRLDGVEQDLIIRQADLSSASLESLGFAGGDPANITIETWSEFLTSPEPQVQPVLRQDSVDGQSVAMADQELSFGGSMKMAAGRSFLVGQESQTLGLVSKQWITTSDSRQFLVESTPLVLVEGKLSAVPAGQPGAMKSSRKASGNRMEALNALPRHRSDRQEASILPLKSAAKGLLAWLSLPGLILDYSTISGSLTNYTFAGNVTYYLSSATTCTGTNTWVECGAVLKYASSASLTIKTPLTWQASPYRPVVLCSWDDKSIGQPITGASGTPGTNIYASTALILDASSSGAPNTPFNLAHVRIANAQTAIQIIQGTNPHAIKHAQFVNCGTGINATSTTFSLYNALLANVRTGFSGSSVVGDLEHLTVDGGDAFQNGTVFSSLGLTNCLIAGVTNVSVGTSVIQSFIFSSNTGLFQNLSVGTSHYLPANSPFRNIGTTGINPTLAGELIDLTTAAPIELGTNWTVAANTYLQPQAARDTDIPDIGYHAYPCDYIVKGITINASKRLGFNNGVAVGFYSTTGISFSSSGTPSFVSAGLPESMNHLFSVNAVFEQPQTWLTSPTVTFLSPPAIASPGTGATHSLRFTEVDGGTLYPQFASGNISVQDCALKGVTWTYNSYSGTADGATNTIRNNLFERCAVDWTQGYASTPYYLGMTLQNNLFSRSTVALTHYGDGCGLWSAYDNLFDTCATVSLTEYGTNNFTAFGYNGYISTTRFLSGTGDKTGLLRDFISGPLGDYYYPTNSTANSLSTLINGDTYRAPSGTGVGLYQYTTTLDQAKDAATQLDIGMHYVALENHRASVEFSGTQGNNNWYYYRTTTPQGNTLALLTSYSTLGSGLTWWDSSLPGNDTYTWVYAVGQHPGVNYDSVRLWQSPVASRVSIWSTANATSSTDGVRLYMQKGTVALSSWITSSAGVTTTLNARTYVQTGDPLLFQLNMNGNNGIDSTAWNPLVMVHRGIDADGDGVPDWLEDSNGDGTVNSSDGLGDFDNDGVIDRLDAKPWDPTVSTFQITIDRPANGSTVN